LIGEYDKLFDSKTHDEAIIQLKTFKHPNIWNNEQVLITLSLDRTIKIFKFDVKNPDFSKENEIGRFEHDFPVF